MSEPATLADPKGAAKPNPVLDTVGNWIGRLRCDDDMFELLECFGSLNPDAIEKVDVARARSNPTIADAVKKLLKKQGRSDDPAMLVPGVTTHEISIPGPAGPLPATVYQPGTTSPTTAAALPVVVYFHGGGWVIADRKVYDGGARGLCKESQAIVVSVDYRQAPEHKFPAAWDDALAAFDWVCGTAGAFGGDPMRVALAGESAGGNLALATALAAKRQGLHMPRHVLAIYPVTQTSLNTESYLENAIAKPLNRAMVEWFVKHLIRSEDDLKDDRLQLIDADLAGMAPVTIITCSIDPLRSDGAKMEDALEKANVPVQRRNYDGVTHEFFGCSAVVEKARQAQAWAGQRLRASF